MLPEAQNQQRVPDLFNFEVQEQKRERIRREIELAKQQATIALMESRELLDRIQEILEKRRA